MTKINKAQKGSSPLAILLFVLLLIGVIIILFKTGRPFALSYPLSAVLGFLPQSTHPAPGTLGIDIENFGASAPIKETIETGRFTFFESAKPSLMKTYLANSHIITEEEARQLAEKFGFAGDPEMVGTTPPAYYGFVWDTPTKHFEVTGGSGSGGFKYYLKGSSQAGSLVSDEEAIEISTEFLSSKDVLPVEASIYNVFGNIASIAPLSGFNEPHKQVYIRKSLDILPVIEWEGAQGSSKMDDLEVWIGSNGRVLYATNNNHFTTINYETPDEYLLPLITPEEAWKSIGNGNGRVSWMTINGIDSRGLEGVNSNWGAHGKLLDSKVEGVSLVYFHNRLYEGEKDCYYPSYIFEGTGTIAWQEDYTPSPAEANLTGRTAHVKVTHPAIVLKY